MQNYFRFVLSLLIIILFSVPLEGKDCCKCPFKQKCSTNPLRKIYPNQNMCLLLQEIPDELKKLPYVVLPTCEQYDVVRFNYNKRFNVFPHAVIQPRTTKEVAHVVRILRSHKLDFALRSCGHCYGPGSLSNGYVIDLSKFNKIKLDIRSQEATIGAGCHLGTVIETLGDLDLAIPTGTCPSVGNAGLAMGGGLGLLARQFGATCDAVKSFKVVTADSKIINVDNNNFSDLFWALRGGGNGSYGVVTEITYNMHFVPRVSFLELTWNWNPATIPTIFQAWQTWIATLPRDISTEVHIKHMNGKPTFTIIALKVSSKPFNEWKKTFEPLHPHVSQHVERYVNVAKSQASSYPEPFSKVKSKMLFKPIAKAGIQVIVDFFEKLRKSNDTSVLVYFEFGAGGGKLAEGKTAYFPRKALAWFFQFIYWTFEQQTVRSLKLINDFYKNISPFCSPFSYANLVDYDLGADYLRAYYGDHVPRLVHIKDKYDPKNIFRWRQSIPTSL